MTVWQNHGAGVTALLLALRSIGAPSDTKLTILGQNPAPVLTTRSQSKPVNTFAIGFARVRVVP